MADRRKHLKIDREHPLAGKPHKVLGKALHGLFRTLDRPVLVAVGGPGGIGKTHFAHDLAHELRCAVVMGLDDYKTPREARYSRGIYGAHPEANELDMLREHLLQLRGGLPIEKPLYCREHGRIRSTEIFAPDRFVIVEGEVATYSELTDVIDFSIFIDSHWKTQLNTRLVRDIEERGYEVKKAIATFLYSNLHEFPKYGAGSKNWCDVHIHCNGDYSLVIDAVCSTRIDHLSDFIVTGEQPPSENPAGNTYKEAEHEESKEDFRLL
ncbi:MAG: uridine kinase family protein [Candidatus Sumerlaeota bacterium]